MAFIWTQHFFPVCYSPTFFCIFLAFLPASSGRRRAVLQLLWTPVYQKVVNRVGWLSDRHGPSLILYDTAPLFVYTDQLLCHCIFICSNVHWRFAYLAYYGFLYCFCLLAESCETVNHYQHASNPSVNKTCLLCIPFAMVAGYNFSVTKP